MWLGKRRSGFISPDRSALDADAKADGHLTQEPVVGGMIFIDLFSPGGIGDGQVTHVGMVEYIEEMVVALVQGNGEPDPTVVTPTRKSTAPGIIRQRLRSSATRS